MTLEEAVILVVCIGCVAVDCIWSMWKIRANNQYWDERESQFWKTYKELGEREQEQEQEQEGIPQEGGTRVGQVSRTTSET